ncbi:MAG TPA: zinc ribbon domain-containing protein [Euryarchaeota archaeon]|nr:hypothetical protein BMS3Bbin15_00292 [archaeon BMS3Bbin15]HDL15151.1 zinc ribbon domain-containing protein [Euryarchaeota archaeon]
MEEKTVKVAGLFIAILGLTFFYLACIEKTFYITVGFATLAIALVIFGLLFILNKNRKNRKKNAKTSEKLICPNCKEEVISAGKFCGNCGALLEKRKP